jgi:hypothetical protein
MADHPNKHIRAALEYATSSGWTVKKAGPRAHAWGVIHCQHGHGNCSVSALDEGLELDFDRQHASLHEASLRRFEMWKRQGSSLTQSKWTATRCCP